MTSYAGKCWLKVMNVIVYVLNTLYKKRKSWSGSPVALFYCVCQGSEDAAAMFRFQCPAHFYRKSRNGWPLVLTVSGPRANLNIVTNHGWLLIWSSKESCWAGLLATMGSVLESGHKSWTSLTLCSEKELRIKEGSIVQLQWGNGSKQPQNFKEQETCHNFYRILKAQKMPRKII